jgi:hypothetical protein
MSNVRPLENEVLRTRPNRLVTSALLGNCAGAVACAIVVAAFLVGWGEFSKLGVSGLLVSSFGFASQAWLVGAIYLVVVVPTVLVVRSLFPAPVVGGVGLVLGLSPGLVVLLGGNSYFGSAGLAHGAVAALVAIWLSYGRWGGGSAQRPS